MFRAAILLASSLLAGCAAPEAGAQASVPAEPAYRTIGFELNSWGRPLRSWEVRADGTARHMTIDGSPFGAHRREHREFVVDAAAYARLAALAAKLPTPRPDRADCKALATDMPYGALRLSSGDAEDAVSFDTGCQDASYGRFVAQLRSMDELVGMWAAQRPADRVEEVAGH